MPVARSPGAPAHDESEFLHHAPCPACHSSDGLGVYSDGHTYCFVCRVRSSGDQAATVAKPKEHTKVVRDFLEGEPRALKMRGLSLETAAKWGYYCGRDHDTPIQIANYYDQSGARVAQKVRYPDKTFAVRGSLKEAGLYGQWLWRDGGKMVVVTEGELDALSVSQLQGNKWPVVSVPNGAGGAAKAIAGALKWLAGFDSVVFMFDSDEPGQQAVAQCVALLPPGRAKVARLPLKDANEMLQAGRGGEVIDAIWSAKVYRPQGIVTLEDVREDALRDPEEGLPWCFEELTRLTYGRRLGECYAVGAGTGVGKTDFLTQQIKMDAVDLKQKVGVFFLEQQPAETAKRIAGKLAGKCFHIPGEGWTHEELVDAYAKLEAGGGVFLNDHFGMAEWDGIRDSIRYLHHAEGVNIFYLDHLTALASGSTDERVELERIMADIGSLIKELNVILILVSHLATPEGKSHEEGGRVMIRHFKGSRAIGFWCHYMFGLERDQQATDEKTRATTTFRVLKDRYTGRSTGATFFLGYKQESGTLYELEGNPFEDEPLAGGKTKEDF